MHRTAKHAYIKLLLRLGEAITSAAINEEDDSVHVGEILSPDLARYNSSADYRQVSQQMVLAIANDCSQMVKHGVQGL